jgi:hypothetical protein
MYHIAAGAGGLLPLARRESIPFGISLLIAELFFKFHSFTLECIAFLLLWYVLGRTLRVLAGQQ